MFKNDLISPIDGRYSEYTTDLRQYFSEFALQQYRVQVEIEWLIFMCNEAELEGTRKLEPSEVNDLRMLYQKFSENDSTEIKKIEETTAHDVKAIEYFIKDSFKNKSVKDVLEFVHFGCTSEDINNISHALMLKDGIENVIFPELSAISFALTELATCGAEISMLSRTHGQSASPTTIGKEVAVYITRLERQMKHLYNQDYLAKFNGAVGNYNAHIIAYPNQNWFAISNEFIRGLGLVPNFITTQIESHDYMAEIFDTMSRINTILIDLNRDFWSYISLGYFIQKVKEGEVGSSTMPHKVNPINFENSEGNLGLANALFSHFSAKLPISRLQRDLTDSTVIRNLGSAFAYSLIAYKNTLKGLAKIDVNIEKLDADLNDNWEVLTEAVQTVMRVEGIEKPYEKLKDLSRGKKITKETLHKFITNLNIDSDSKKRLLALSPNSYTGLATELVLAITGKGCGGNCQCSDSQKGCSENKSCSDSGGCC